MTWVWFPDPWWKERNDTQKLFSYFHMCARETHTHSHTRARTHTHIHYSSTKGIFPLAILPIMGILYLIFLNKPIHQKFKTITETNFKGPGSGCGGSYLPSQHKGGALQVPSLSVLKGMGAEEVGQGPKSIHCSCKRAPFSSQSQHLLTLVPWAPRPSSVLYWMRTYMTGAHIDSWRLMKFR